jgi:hypothetical protein
VDPHMCGRRAPDSLGKAPSKIEQLGGRLDQQDSPADGLIQAAIYAGAVRALRRRAAHQASLASAGTVTAGGRFPNVKIRSGEAEIARRLERALREVADELEAEGQQ